MEAWVLKCSNCGTENDIQNQKIVVRCGIARCHCTCTNCKHEFDSQQDYLIWLGLPESSLAELDA